VVFAVCGLGDVLPHMGDGPLFLNQIPKITTKTVFSKTRKKHKLVTVVT